MDRQRRMFLRGSVWVLVPSLGGLSLLGQQRPSGGVHPPDPAQPLNVSVIIGTDSSMSKPAVRRDRGEQFRHCLEQLCDCANGLRKAAAEVDLGQTFPVQFYKDAHLLERLAKQLKSLAKT